MKIKYLTSTLAVTTSALSLISIIPANAGNFFNVGDTLIGTNELFTIASPTAISPDTNFDFLFCDNPEDGGTVNVGGASTGPADCAGIDTYAEIIFADFPNTFGGFLPFAGGIGRIKSLDDALDIGEESDFILDSVSGSTLDIDLIKPPTTTTFEDIVFFTYDVRITRTDSDPNGMTQTVPGELIFLTDLSLFEQAWGLQGCDPEEPDCDNPFNGDGTYELATRIQSYTLRVVAEKVPESSIILSLLTIAGIALGAYKKEQA